MDLRSFVESLDQRQEQNLLLDVRSEMQQLHDLGDARSRHPAQAGQLRIIPNCFVLQQPLKPDRECQEPGTRGMGRSASSPPDGVFLLLSLPPPTSSA